MQAESFGRFSTIRPLSRRIQPCSLWATISAFRKLSLHITTASISTISTHTLSSAQCTAWTSALTRQSRRMSRTTAPMPTEKKCFFPIISRMRPSPPSRPTRSSMPRLSRQATSSQTTSRSQLTIRSRSSETPPQRKNTLSTPTSRRATARV